ncbi:MAG: hypothetical protein ACTH3E_00310 [Psychroflexus halocasei]
MTHLALCPMAASMISALVGIHFLVRFSNTCVDHIGGICVELQICMISSIIIAKSLHPVSIAKHPLAS